MCHGIQHKIPVIPRKDNSDILNRIDIKKILRGEHPAKKQQNNQINYFFHRFGFVGGLITTKTNFNFNTFQI